MADIRRVVRTRRELQMPVQNALHFVHDLRLRLHRVPVVDDELRLDTLYMRAGVLDHSVTALVERAAAGRADDRMGRDLGRYRNGADGLDEWMAGRHVVDAGGQTLDAGLAADAAAND